MTNKTNSPFAISVRNLKKTYGTKDNPVPVLHGLDVDIQTGTFTSIMGPSGSGKSTLMHLMAGLDVADSGSIKISGVETTALNDKQLTVFRRENIGFVFQSFNLLPMLTAEQNILLPLDLAGKNVDKEWFNHLVNTFGIADRLKHLPSQLSGGQIQRVAITRALVTRPSVVFADEPTGNLDSKSSEEVLKILRLSVDELGQTVVMVTHEPEAAAVGDRIINLIDGEIAEDTLVKHAEKA